MCWPISSHLRSDDNLSFVFFPREDIKDEAGLFQRIHIQMSDYSALHTILNTNKNWLKRF
jgi:hypothetical protein